MTKTYQCGKTISNMQLRFTLAKLLFTGNIITVHPFPLVPGR